MIIFAKILLLKRKIIANSANYIKPKIKQNRLSNMIKDLNAVNSGANNIRVLAVSMVEKAKSGHPGGAMGGADFVNVLYSSFIVNDPDDGNWFSRDRFFLDPGHMSPMLYSVLALTGKYTIEELQQFRQWGSVTPGHPE